MTTTKETLIDDAELETVQGGIALPKDIEQVLRWLKDPPLVPKPKPQPFEWATGPRFPFPFGR